MRVRLLLFAAASELAGSDALEFDLPIGSSIGDLRRELVNRVPALAAISPYLMFALDAEYATEATTIGPDAEVACIPPVSGG